MQTTQLQELAEWRPDLEARLTYLHDAVAELQQTRASPALIEGGTAADHLAAHPQPSPHGEFHGQPSHDEQFKSGGSPMVNSASSSELPVTGMNSLQFPLVNPSANPSLLTTHMMTAMGTTAPAMHFPQFTGENPNLWKTLAEQYFHMFSTHESYWVPMPTLHFKGAASIWLQAVHKRLASLDWLSFTSLVCTRFGRDRHQLLIRQFYAIKQITTVADYIERFDVLMNHLMYYSEDTHLFYFLTRFVEGLRPDIRAVVMIQRPADLDTACSFALLQEEVSEGESVSPPRQADQRYVKFPARGMITQPVSGSSRPPSRADDHRGMDTTRATADERITALRAYRRAKGLCYKCGEKWNKEHTYPATVQSHIVEELLSLFLPKEMTGSEAPSPTTETELICSISIHALTGSSANIPGVIQLQAFVEDKEILILVDSGSSASFINKHLADLLTGARPLLQPCKVNVADGTQHRCSSYIPKCQWSANNHQFHTNLKILPLGSFDAIFGMDWLEEHNPDIDWVAKTLKIHQPQGLIHLQGHRQENVQCSAISVTELSNMCRQGSATHLIHLYALDGELQIEEIIPSKVQTVLDQFSEVFATPTTLPPRHACNHRIPLMPGAQPINMRAYRHKPELKSEIERQVLELLKSGIIQHSTSHFSSLAILVRKKDGTWRLCVDYRALNSMTVVSKYPVPIIDELLDELAGAKWFSKMDLRAGYHQIRLAEGEEFKTAFQTHSGHWEYKVMPFGLAGAPATFLGAMNATLQPLLRKCVVVFFDDILVYSDTLAAHTEHLRSVLALLRRDNWQVKLSKCSFGQQQISYLGHVINSQGVSSDPQKIIKVATWPVPQNSKEVRSFLGLAGYYRKFVQHFGIIARPLFNLLKKQAPFVWTSETETAFQLLKQKLVEAPVLKLTDFNKTFTGVGAVLQQEGHPIAYMSKPLGPRNRGLLTYENECLAVLMAIEQWRPYMQHKEFIIRTDQKSLVHLDDQRLTTNS